MIGINTNLGSLIVQSNLKKSTNALNTAIERMTTGFKINHAKDNAANYSISTSMSSKISAYEVAEDNALIGLDILNTASSSIELISSGLSRLRALAEQAAIPLRSYYNRVVPEDEEVPLALVRGIPLLLTHNRCAAVAYSNIARRITGQRVPLMKI